MVTGLIRGVNHFHSLLDKPIKLEISLKSSWRSSQLECKVESAKTEVNFSLYTPLLPLNDLYEQHWTTIETMSGNECLRFSALIEKTSVSLLTWGGLKSVLNHFV